MALFQTLTENSGKIMLAVLSGVLLTAGFPIIGVSYTVWGALALLFFAIRDTDVRKSFLLGFLAGLCHYLSLIYWLAFTMRVYGQLSFSLSILALLLLALYLAIYPAIFAVLMTWTARRPVVMVIMAPVFWICLEYLRSILFSGFPWGIVGYSQADQLDLIQFADILGVYGVSGIILLANAALLMLVLAVSGKRWQGRGVSGRAAAGSCLFVLIALCAVLIYGNARVNEMDERMAAADTLDVAVVQGNIAQMHKWDRRFMEATVDKYFELSDRASHPSPELIVWPETAAPFYFRYNMELTEKVTNGIDKAETYFIIGAPSVEFVNRTPVNYNSAYLIGPQGEVHGRYDKVHLVPFGEYVPFKKWLPFINSLVAQVGDFDAGRRGDTMGWADTRVGMLICYEVIFPPLSVEMVKNGADFLINMTNDAWFGRTGAPYQHFSMAVFRAIENRRTLVRSANTGISGYIDPAGRAMEKSPLFETAVLSRRIPLIKDYESFYTRHGDWLPIACFIVTGFIIVLKLLFKNKGGKQ